MRTPGCRPAPPPAFGRHEGRGGRGLPNPEPPMLDDLLSHPVPADTNDDVGQVPSPAVQPLDELALYGCRPFQDDAHTSSRCHLSPGQGSLRRIWLAKPWPNLRAHCRTVSWLTSIPRAASISLTMRRLSRKRK